MKPVKLKAAVEFNVGSKIGQCRAIPVALDPNGTEGVLLVHGGDFDVDPFEEMFFFPSDTLKLSLYDQTGKLVWRRDLGKAVVPGLWFCPVLAFDLDNDGVDEIWFVNNTNPQHPLALSKYCLERLSADTGETTGQWPWPYNRNQTISHMYRNFLSGGHVQGKPVLITAQGTYEDMHIQGHNPGMELRWRHDIAKDAPGARGSHMCSVADIDNDGDDELFWGERCVSLRDGRELFCADRDLFAGHSDINQPFLDRESGKWFLFTARESGEVSPRVVTFDDQGRRVWHDVDQGHMDMGWVARLQDNGRHVAAAIRIGHKVCGPDGRFHTGMTEFAYDALTGKPMQMGFSLYRTIPVDLNGDGFHELVRGHASGGGEVLDRKGNVLGQLGASIAMATKFMKHPGEQVLAYYPNGDIKFWRDENAEDGDLALERYRHPFYRANRKLTASGYNIVNLGGI